jgi:hypothetical protein
MKLAEPAASVVRDASVDGRGGRGRTPGGRGVSAIRERDRAGVAGLRIRVPPPERIVEYRCRRRERVVPERVGGGRADDVRSARDQRVDIGGRVGSNVAIARALQI